MRSPPVPPDFAFPSISRAEEDARGVPPTTQAQSIAGAKPDEPENATTLGGNTTTADESLAPESSKTAIGKVKKKGKAKLTPKERKERKVRIRTLSK